MRNNVRTVSLLACGALLLACGDSQRHEALPTAPNLASSSARAPSLNLYGLGGLVRAVPRARCVGEAYREFDFWLGDWDVFDPDGQQVGTNTIASELGGCVVAEHWTGAGGVRGRSINAYDAETGQWHQTWVTANTIGHLRLAGGIVDGEMVLEGVRDPTVFGFPLFNEFIWTVLDPDVVRQVGVLRIPAIDFMDKFTGIYHRAEDISPAPEAPTTQCQPGGISEETRQLDFWLGDWRVEAQNGLVLGSSMVRSDLRDCLFEERFATPKGYEAVAFTYWDRVEARWYRTYIDNQGERLELSGEFDGDRLVLTGSDRVPGGGTVGVTVTVAPVAADIVELTVETSRDGGATWKQSAVLRFVAS